MCKSLCILAKGIFMKLSVSSYSFHPLISSGKKSYEECIKAAADMGFEGFEFAGLPSGDRIEAATRMKNACKEAGLEVVNYTIGADFLNGYGGGKPEDEVGRLKDEVDTAVIRSAPGMRHDLTWDIPNKRWQTFDTVLPSLAKQVREVTEYAASKGIRTMVENHGFFSQDSERIEKLIAAVAHDNFGALCDVGNFVCADEDPITAVGRIAPYAFLVHVKDFHIKSGMEPNPGRGFFQTRGGNYIRGSIVGHGNIPVAQVLRTLKKYKYNGYVSIEFEGMEDSLTGIEVSLENLRRFIYSL